MNYLDRLRGTGNPVIDNVLGLTKDFRNPMGENYNTPGINPNEPSPHQQMPQPTKPAGVLGTVDNFLNKPGGSFLMNLLAQSGYSDKPSSPFGAIGRAGLMTQQQQQERGMNDLQKRLFESQIGLNDARANSPYAGNAAKPPASIAEYNLYSEQSKAAGQKPMSFESWKQQNVGGRVVDVNGAKWWVSNVPGVEAKPLSTTESEAAAAATIKGAEQTASSEAQLSVKDRVELPAQIAKDQEYLDKGEKFLKILENNELNTGPIQGLFPAMTTNAQLFEAFTGENVIQSISQATFGALSEGERAFLRDTNPSRNLTEEANIDIIKTKMKYIKAGQQRLKDRLAGDNVIDFSELPD